MLMRKNVKNNNMSRGCANEDYNSMLAVTGMKAKQQIGKKGTYEMNPDNQMSLWNMIE